MFYKENYLFLPQSLDYYQLFDYSLTNYNFIILHYYSRDYLNQSDKFNSLNSLCEIYFMQNSLLLFCMYLYYLLIISYNS
ncbi:hypothetical protein A1OE_358 [Candidatus Endolissoclinum faulkneri L2]|uniref:Uncharacterized protein n=1 Tax=Candidatus Endolissoclinum faulkneri L2 TaxID=1193729 RepID=K7Z3J6_9PROT|nr:hypothetical protein A1OE_358 [Candidatus Endolissoclinum faulkneri L2]